MFRLWSVPRFYKIWSHIYEKVIEFIDNFFWVIDLFPLDMINFNPCRFCLILHNISFIVFHVFVTFDLL